MSSPYRSFSIINQSAIVSIVWRTPVSSKRSGVLTSKYGVQKFGTFGYSDMVQTGNIEK